MIKNVIFFCLLFSPMTIACGDKKEYKKNFFQEMSTITTWEDVAPFAGSLVIYRAHEHFSKGDSGYQIDPDSPTPRVGYIKNRVSSWVSDVGPEEGEEGYELQILFKKEAVCSSCALIDSQIAKNKNKNIKMRKITLDEKAIIKKVLQEKEAQFMNQFFIEGELERLLAK
jgi:hypothetical protein